ncbi:MAG: 5'-nucleotidase C-terminal domain-containing protein [Desulfomonilia bacterium]|jgi:5'-nucleotidase|nr:5'-nucleotidase C-terminal domain-containing protein [Desulfomonilia bacterium]
MKRVKWIALAGMILLVFMAGCRWANVTFTILQTSDVHHHASGYGPFLDYTPLDTTDSDSVTGGYARLATLINRIRAEQADKGIPTLLFDSGDFTMGTVYDLSAADPISLKFISMMGYDAVTLGNHEFDWSPSGLAMMLANGAASGFNVPVVASNTLIPEGNPLQAIKDAGLIVEKKVIEYPYGVKVGVLGIMGRDADSKAPVAAPVTFDHDYAAIQRQVNDLRNKHGAQLVIVLSHGGVDNRGAGDDADLAANVRGIDIIASGHYHTATADAFVMGDPGTIIFSPGEYGEYLSRLDVTYNVLLRKVVHFEFTLAPVDDTVPGDPAIQAMVEAYHASMNASLVSLGVTLEGPVSRTDFALELDALKETGLGNLAADSVRSVASSLAPFNDGNPCDFSVVASGVIRDNIYPGTTSLITFADIYNVLPLGISPDTAQPVPGYPLMSVYVTAGDLRNICEAALTVAPVIGSDFYLNFSGLKVDYDPGYAPYYQGVRGVALYDPADTFCLGEATPLDLLDEDTVYHCVVDLYALQMMGVVTGMGLQIIPRYADGTIIDPSLYLGRRIDAGADPGVQELKEWMALLSFLGHAFPADGYGIPEALYGLDGAALGRINILN